MKSKFLSIDQAAKQLGLSYKTVFRYIHRKKNKLKATKLGSWRIKREDLDKFLRDSSNIRRS